MPPVLTKCIQMQVKQRNEQIDALQQQILGLERTRDRCLCCPDNSTDKFNLMVGLNKRFSLSMQECA